MRGEPARGVREHAGAIGDLEMDVERRAPLRRWKPLELAPAGVVLEKTGAGGADDADEIRDDGGCGPESGFVERQVVVGVRDDGRVRACVRERLRGGAVGGA